MARRKIIYRDYRKGRAGEFTSEAVYRRAQASGSKKVRREYTRIYDIASLEDLSEYEDMEPTEEFHATGDT